LSSEARTPLFDRLIDEQPGVHHETPPARTLTRAGLVESVRRELEKLFNTRLSLPPHRLEGRSRSVIDYGIPDFRDASPGATVDRERLARALTEAITAFEPRLKEVRVEVEPAADRQDGLVGRISALLSSESIEEPISFMTVFAQSRNGVEVHAAA
jgi:type VI secretion system lysozyme-like protein